MMGADTLCVSASGGLKQSPSGSDVARRLQVTNLITDEFLGLMPYSQEAVETIIQCIVEDDEWEFWIVAGIPRMPQLGAVDVQYLHQFDTAQILRRPAEFNFIVEFNFDYHEWTLIHSESKRSQWDEVLEFIRTFDFENK